MKARGLGRLLAGVVCAGIAIGGLAAEAGAKRGYYVLNPSIYLAFTAPGSNGHRIEVLGSGDRVEVTVKRGPDLEATYTVPGYARGNRLKANLGRLGRIDLRFDPTSRELGRADRDCRGRRAVIEEGHFEGKIRFRGEGGYTGLSANRIGGSIWHDFRQVCKRPAWVQDLVEDIRKEAAEEKEPKESEEGEDVTVLTAASGSRNRAVSVSFASILLEPRLRGEDVAISLVKATVRERRGRIEIERTRSTGARRALRTGPTVDGEVSTATLNPPRPFSGKATYSAAPGADPSWTGPLRVNLLGAPAVPLAGPGFVAAFCRAGTLEAALSCTQPVAAEVKEFDAGRP